MKIIKEDSLPSISKLKNKEEFVNQLVQQVMIICKEDKSFSIVKKLKTLDEYKSSLKEKNENLKNLLEKSSKIKEEFDKQITNVDEENVYLKQRLIEHLGGEI